MKNGSGIELSGIKRMKPFFHNGRTALILKLSLPLASTGNTRFDEAFNHFYKTLCEDYMKECKQGFKPSSDAARPATLHVECSENQSPGGVISIKRFHRLVLENGEIRCSELLDSFNLKTGFLEKPKHIKCKQKNTKNADK